MKEKTSAEIAAHLDEINTERRAAAVRRASLFWLVVTVFVVGAWFVTPGCQVTCACTDSPATRLLEASEVLP